MKRVLLLLTFVATYSFAQTAPAPTKPEAPQVSKPAPTIESLSAENASLKAQLAISQADARVLEIQASLSLQACAVPELMTAKLVAQEARKASDKLKSKSK